MFVSGISDIHDMRRLLKKKKDKFSMVGIHGDVSDEDQRRAIHTSVSANKIKVIVATNIAESSLTIEDLDLVICLGMHKTVEYPYGGHSVRSVITRQWISKSSAIQRVGRTGRIRHGLAFRLYSESLFETFREHPVPEIHNNALHNLTLELKLVFPNKDVIEKSQQLLDPPAEERMQDSLQLLHKCK